jgi:hypothetical protein
MTTIATVGNAVHETVGKIISAIWTKIYHKDYLVITNKKARHNAGLFK